MLGHVQDTDLLPLLLPNIFAITNTMSQLSFSERVLPTVKDIIKSKDLPDNVTITLLDSIPHLKEKTTGKEFADGMTVSDPINSKMSCRSFTTLLVLGHCYKRKH